MNRSADDHANAWEALEARLSDWAPASGAPDIRSDEDGYRLPSGEALAVALQIAARLRGAGVCGPNWLVQDGDGGIDFEWKSENRTETLNVNSRGETELLQFEHSKLLSRQRISLARARKE